MMRSMYSGVSGLRVHQTKMDVIGNNIANVNTVGFKSQRVTFSEVFSQTLQAGTGASDETGRGGRNPMQVGLGVNVSSIDSLMTSGAAQRTDNPFDLMVEGDGFLIVSNGAGQSFTKAGALRMDEEGNLVIPNGMKVMGWPSKDGTIVKGEVSTINLNAPEYKSAPPKATTQTSVSGNLNIKDGSPIKNEDGTEKAQSIPVQIKVYDSLGNLYTTNLEMSYDEATKSWNVSPQVFNNKGEVPDKALPDADQYIKLTDTNGNSQVIKKTDVFDNLPILKFDEKGNLDLKNSTGLMQEADKDGKLQNVPKFEMKAFTLPGINATIGNVDVTDPKKSSNVSIDISGLTQYSSKSNINSNTINGQAAGNMTGYDIGGDGVIMAYYDNGDMKKIAQLAVAEFTNPAGLERVGDNLFRATVSSGDFDGIGKAGVFQAGVLEMSNVDLSSEFTEMITTQRGFQANSRIISVSDEMLQELVNLKR